MDNPKLMPIPFAEDSSLKNEIPTDRTISASSAGATYRHGFPPITMMSIASGGIPPDGKDFNGILNDLSSNISHLNKGGRFKFDSEFAAQINGYPKGSVLLSDSLHSEYISLVDNNTSDFNVSVDPTKWAAYAGRDYNFKSVDPFILAIAGQSNACGSRAGGKNPASDMVKTWDGARGVWGSSDYTQTPWSDPSPNGNMGNNNVALALAHRIAEETGRPVYIIYDAVGGRPIEDWMSTGTTSVRWASLQSKINAALASPELASRGVTHVDAVVWAQGEENALTDNFNAYTGKLRVLVAQFRDSTWFDHSSPLLFMGMSNLHTRYHVGDAQIAFCENEDRNCIYVNSMGLKTQFDEDGTTDATHFLGVSLWEAGYHRAWYALQSRAFTHRSGGAPLAYGRASGRWNGETVAILGFSGFSSYNSKTNEFPVDGVVGLDSISWGWLCAATGRYSLAGGYTCTVDAAGRYNHVWGRDIAATATANYSGGFGYQNQLASNYGLVSGRGNIVADDGGAAFGTFSKYVIAQTDPVIAQIGTGSTDSNRKNAITVRKSGAIELFVGTSAVPTQLNEMTVNASNSQIQFTVKCPDGVMRKATLALTAV